MLIARGLGPEQYGVMIFLLSTFTAVRQLFDMGSSTAFFTFLSRSQRSRRFVGLYFLWLGFQFFLTLVAVGLLFPASWIELIWNGEQRNLVILAFLAAYMQSVLWATVLQMGESQRLTRWVQVVAITVALAHLLLIAMAWWGAWLSVASIFCITIIEWIIAAIVVARQLHFSAAEGISDAPKSVFREFLRYCLPLIPYAWVSFIYEFADRWLLQNYAGSIQQAYYSIAFQFGAVTAIVTSSILNIFWKEIAEAHHQKNSERVAMLYQKVSRGLFFIAAAGAGFLAPWADDILRITLGPAYIGGAATLMIMFFYPAHQSIGQIGGVMAYATELVSTYVKIGMVSMILSVVVTYIVLADGTASLPGLGLGSLGLAGKMVVMQILSVNVLAFYLSRSLGIKFDWLFQPVVAIACLAAGLMASMIAQAAINTDSPIGFTILVAGFIYCIMLAGLIQVAPSLAGINRINWAEVFIRLRLVRR